MEPPKTTSLGTISFVPGASVRGSVHPVRGRADVCHVDLALVTRNAPASASMEGLKPTRTTVDPKGRFRFLGVAAGRYRVTAGCPQLVDDSQEIDVVPKLEAEILAALRPDEPKSVLVVLSSPFDTLGKPWSLALWRVEDDNHEPVPLAATGTNGEWKLEGLRARARYLVDVRDSLGFDWKSVEFIPDDSGGRVEIDVEGYRFRGRISLGQAPIVADLVFGGRRGNRFQSDERGEFKGELPRLGLWRVEIHTESGVQRVLKVPVVKPPSAVEASVEIVLPGGTVEGSIVEPSGTLAARATLTFSTTSNKESFEQLVVEGGRFRLSGLPDESLTMTASSVSGSSEPTVVDVGDESVPGQITLQLKGLKWFRGRVVGVDGVGVAGATVFPLMRPEASSDLSAPMAAELDGSFEVPLRPGASHVDLVISAPGYAVRVLRAPADHPEQTRILLGVSGGTLRISTAKRTGKIPVLYHAGAYVVAMAIPLVSSVRMPPPERPDELVVSGMEPGEYTVCFVDPSAWPPRPETVSGCASGVLHASAVVVLESQGR